MSSGKISSEKTVKYSAHIDIKALPLADLSAECEKIGIHNPVVKLTITEMKDKEMDDVPAAVLAQPLKTKRARAPKVAVPEEVGVNGVPVKKKPVRKGSVGGSGDEHLAIHFQ